MTTIASLPEPASHSYLGGHLEDVRSGDQLVPGEVYDLLLLPLEGVVLFPGETLPLRVRQRELVQLLSLEGGSQAREGVQRVGVVDLICSRGRHSLRRLGTTIEVRARAPHMPQQEEEEELLCVSRGKQRFEVLSFQIGRAVKASVRVLEEALPRRRHSSLPIASCCDAIPRLAYEACDPHRLARRAYDLAVASLSQQDLGPVWRRWGPQPDDGIYGAEADPLAFSYFLAGNLPVASAALHSLLRASSATHRLRLAMELLVAGREKHLACVRCAQRLASCSALVNVPGAEGVAGAYVNPHGVVHQTITVRQLLPQTSITLEGSACARDSWFPGYAWTILYCGRCGNHLGWRFTALRRQQTARSLRSEAEEERLRDRLVLDWLQSAGLTPEALSSVRAGSFIEQTRQAVMEIMQSSSLPTTEDDHEEEEEEEEQEGEMSESHTVDTEDEHSVWEDVDDDHTHSDNSVDDDDDDHTHSEPSLMTAAVEEGQQASSLVEFWGLRRAALTEV
eukprot:gene7792-8603_t